MSVFPEFGAAPPLPSDAPAAIAGLASAKPRIKADAIIDDCFTRWYSHFSGRDVATKWPPNEPKPGKFGR